MIILQKKTTIRQLLELNDFPNGFVKGVVDIEQRLVALHADMHYELADLLRNERDSKEIDMWGFNLWLENEGIENILEYDSFINIHNNQLHGYPRGGMGILDADIEEKATEVICEWIEM